jgi:hypothetical protein
VRWPWQKERPAHDLWTIARTQEQGREVLLRFRSCIPPGVETGDYPHLVNIHWAFDGQASAGMPPPELHLRMRELEDLLEALEGPALGFLVVSITGNNRKEWVWYVADRDAYMKRVNEALAGGEPYPVEFESVEDPAWSSYTSLLVAASGTAH